MKIYGYYFAILVEKGEWGYVAYAPGVGGVYEEGETMSEATENAYKAACAILEKRTEYNDPITENSRYLKIITALPTSQSIDKFRRTIPDGYIITTPCASSI